MGENQQMLRSPPCPMLMLFLKRRNILQQKHKVFFTSTNIV